MAEVDRSRCRDFDASEAKGGDGKGNQSLPQRLRVVIFVSPRTSPPGRFLARRTVTYLRSTTCRAKVTLSSVASSISRDIPRYFVKQSFRYNKPYNSLAKRIKSTRRKKKERTPSALNFNILIRSRYRYRAPSRALRISIVIPLPAISLNASPAALFSNFLYDRSPNIRENA